MATDPVCGMKVADDALHRHGYHENEYLFCSEHCVHKFEIDPEQYLKKQELKDPVCGMLVTEGSQYSAAHDGKTYYFCSEHCQHKFQSDAEQYLNNNHECDHHTEQAVDESAMYTCPMDPEIKQQGPGACPICGMALEPMGIPVALTRTEYTCPMHPEVTQDHPGSCPKCGMALEPTTVTVEEKNAELIDMSRRFWISAMLAVPVFFLAMIADIVPAWLPETLSMQNVQWIILNQ